MKSGISIYSYGNLLIYKNKYCTEFNMREEAISSAWNYYINEKDYDVLGRDKLSEENFFIAYQLTYLLSKLIAEHNILHFDKKYSGKYTSEKNFNISYALHEMQDKKYILLDISGDKNDAFKNKMNNLINKIEADKKNYLVSEFKEILIKNNLFISLVMSVSEENRKAIYLGPKFCSEKSLYIEIEKNFQRTNQDMKISIAHFYVGVSKKARSWILTSFSPQKSCRQCRRDGKNGFYQAKNTQVTKYNQVICNNLNALGKKGNVYDRVLSPQRTRPILGMNNIFGFIQNAEALQNASASSLTQAVKNLMFSLEKMTSKLSI